jgi:hypothetical protein
MNIFVVDNDPIISASNLCDKHVVKMIVEGCQMLSTVHWQYSSQFFYAGKFELYKKAFENHPCTIWAESSKDNYLWLATHTHALSLEYTNRYGKIHKAHDMTVAFCNYIPCGIPNRALTKFAQAMPDKYKNADPVQAYRNYYIHEKARFAKWKNTNPPLWFSEGVKNAMSMQVLSA